MPNLTSLRCSRQRHWWWRRTQKSWKRKGKIWTDLYQVFDTSWPGVFLQSQPLVGLCLAGFSGDEGRFLSQISEGALTGLAIIPHSEVDMLTVSADLLDWIWSVMNEFISPLSDWISIGNFIISRFHSQTCSSFQPCFHPVYMFWPQIQLYASASRYFIFPFLCTTRCIRLNDSQLGHCQRVLICNTQRTTGLHICWALFYRMYFSSKNNWSYHKQQCLSLVLCDTFLNWNFQTWQV